MGVVLQRVIFAALGRATQVKSFGRVSYQPMTMLDSIALRACSRSAPVSCM
jgi:hypothetical protein